MRTHQDMHAALRTEVVGSVSAGGVQLALVKLQSDKNDIAFSLHVSPNSFTLSGLQLTDLLSFLGFERSACPFHHGRGFCAWANDGIDLEGFAAALTAAYSALRGAERHLQACGFMLPQPEGWGHFHGKASSGRRWSDYTSVHGDGHTSPIIQRMKQAEDDSFRYVFTWIADGQDKGWTTHYHPQHAALSVEVQAAFNLLGLHRFDKCPEFEFESCFWRFVRYEGDFSSTADFAHQAFDAHAENFSPGIEHLLRSHAILQPYGYSLLHMPQSVAERVQREISQHTAPSNKERPVPIGLCQFDIAISFAGTERSAAENLARLVQAAGFSVFYDNFFPEELWGKDLAVLFDDIYRKQSRYCVTFVSKSYIEREWTTHERRSAQARMLKEKGAEYILPIQVEQVELPGLPPTVGYLSLSEFGIARIAEVLIKKLRT